MDQLQPIYNDRLNIKIKTIGAEINSLKDSRGRQYIWQAGPAWNRHAPVLFPIVGRLAGDTLRHDGQAHRLTQHGFARDQAFTLTSAEATRCRFTLIDNAETRAAYPFAFRLIVDYALDGDTLDIVYSVTNTGDVPMPAALGAHPAFQWPLAEGIAKQDHRLVFERPEPAPVRRLDGGLLKPESQATPIMGNILALDEGLFAADAMILDQIDSRSVRFEAPGGPAVEVSWEGFRELGLWSKPEGADFLCIEPWHGMASPQGWDGEFADKPGLFHLTPGETRRLAYRIRIDGA
ncbi:MAG TPA: aldose 1-epimerase family protein [Stellaceae bacterium]|nr:aldose 1-epimerase family protein [Stellaceae bacterium]